MWWLGDVFTLNSSAQLSSWPFLILTLTLASSLLSFGAAKASDVTLRPKTLPRNEKSRALTSLLIKTWENPSCFSQSSPNTILCECHQGLLLLCSSGASRAPQLCSDPIHKHTSLGDCLSLNRSIFSLDTRDFLTAFGCLCVFVCHNLFKEYKQFKNLLASSFLLCSAFFFKARCDEEQTPRIAWALRNA